MAEATFTLRAVDSTRAAFAGVQNSLSKLQQSAKGISQITKLAFGGQAMLGALNMMKQRLDTVATAGEEVGFSDEQIIAALQMESLIEGTLNLFMKLPLALAQVGISIGNAFEPLTKDQIAKKLDDLKLVRFKKEIEASGETLFGLKKDFDQIGMSQEQLTAAKKNLAVTLGAELEAMRGKGDPVATAKKEIELQKVLNDVKKDDTTETQKLADLEKQSGALRAQNMSVDLKQMQSKLQADKDRLSALTFGGKEDTPFLLNMKAEEKSTAQKIKDQEEMIRLLPQVKAEEEKINALMKEQNRLFDEAGQILATGFEDAILSGQKLSEVLRAIGQDLVRLVFSNMITQPLAKGIGTFLSGMRAEGGPVNAGGAYMVGEKGPELFVPSSSGSIVPNGAMGSRGGGSGGVTVNYNIAAGVSRAELVPILEQERRRLKAEIPDMVRRGGGYRAAFA
jgi:hypothetical protein